jgi:3-phenylpropionate/trans-cinnamate dioxygenase ferredoxin subunit
MTGGEWHDVAAEDAIGEGSFEIVETDDNVVAVFNVGGVYLAIEDVCTHDGAELAGGPLDGDQIICPRHGARFCLRTGRALTPPAYEDVPTYPVKVENGRILVQIPE